MTLQVVPCLYSHNVSDVLGEFFSKVHTTYEEIVGGGCVGSTRSLAGTRPADNENSICEMFAGGLRMPRGSVKWFNNAKGFGFITNGEAEDIFVHYSQIQGDGFKTLKQGETVEFELCKGPKGLHAENVLREEHSEV